MAESNFFCVCLSEHGKDLNSISCYRKIYRDVMSNGKSVLEQTIDEKAKK